MSRLAMVTYSVALMLMMGWLLIVGQSILLPVLVGIIAVYILTTAAEALVRVPVLGALPRRWRRFLVLLAFAAAVLVLAAFITSNAAAISAAIPGYAENFDVLQAKFVTLIGVHELPSWANLGERVLDLIDATTLMPTAIATISNGGTVIVAAALYAVFILAELDNLPNKTRRAMGDHKQAAHTLEMARQINEKIGGYLAAKTLVNVILAFVSYAILLLLGIEQAAFWAILIGLLNYIPYIGSIIAVMFPVTMSLVQFASFSHAAIALVTLMIPQIAVGYYIEPKFLGRSVNLSPFTVLLSLAIWTALWGLMGAILAIPLTAMVMIILAEIPNTRFIAVMMSETGDL
ncbi:AI-2E family transporter [Parasedimentitalea psychrophila]|uniref:AI-2E family transporter n=1 Tax=Parasedimentitalea psychrophila TaxID=2997337 RepID=A0A9Y2P2I7_9RHOB|nr:AI-2E family transporter [Parasedimentitalea psychrophila]WIY26701.1 AI-2E family transporter [Parasedimentitalea psychrophila]